MKNPLQIGLLLICLVAVVGGVTFVAHYNWNVAPAPIPPPASQAKETKRAPEQTPMASEPPARVFPPSVDVGELRPDGPPSRAEFWCWSGTRKQFPLRAAEKTGDPCFTVTCTPLTAEECEALAAKWSRPKRSLPVAAGYHVVVTIRESPGTALLELGPLDRRIMLSGNPDEPPLQVRLTGMVRGDVAIGAHESEDRIALGPFPAAEGTASPRGIWLATEQPGARLKIDSWTPEYLVAKLEEVPAGGGIGKPGWRLSVEVPPNRAAGPLPEDSAVYLKLLGEPPRRIRVPVTGNAYR
jgi:hypothetical protein